MFGFEELGLAFQLTYPDRAHPCHTHGPPQRRTLSYGPGSPNATLVSDKEEEMVTPDDHSEVLAHSTDGHLSLSGPRLLVWGALSLSESFDASISFRTVFFFVLAHNAYYVLPPRCVHLLPYAIERRRHAGPLAKSFVAQKVVLV